LEGIPKEDKAYIFSTIDPEASQIPTGRGVSEIGADTLMAMNPHAPS
jgi:hypothetical protein